MATTIKKSNLPDELPAGCVWGKSPQGERIIVRKSRGEGPHFRVKHGAYGSRLIKAATAEKAVEEFAKDFQPLVVKNKEAFAAFLAACRVAELKPVVEGK